MNRLSVHKVPGISRNQQETATSEVLTLCIQKHGCSPRNLMQSYRSTCAVVGKEINNNYGPSEQLRGLATPPPLESNQKHSRRGRELW